MGDEPANIVAGDLLQLTRSASPQFTTPVLCRVIRPLTEGEYAERFTGWVWLEVYILDADGNAVEKRTIYINTAEAPRHVPAAGAATSRRAAPQRPGTSRRDRPVAAATPRTRARRPQP